LDGLLSFVLFEYIFTRFTSLNYDLGHY